MLVRLALALALLLSSSCLAKERWPEIEPPYTPASIVGARTLHIRPREKPPVTMRNVVWEEKDGRAFLSGEVHDEPDGILDVPRTAIRVMTVDQEKPWWRPGSVAVDEIRTLRKEVPKEPGPNLTPYAVLFCLGLVVLGIALA